jgi:hypothetical protein
MYVTWKPDDGETQTWEFDPEDEWAEDMIAVEKRAGMRWEAWVAECKMGNQEARRILLWHLMRRLHRGLRLDDVPRFKKRNLIVDMSVAEYEENRETWIAAGGEDGDDADLIRRRFEANIDEARKKWGNGDAGKALSSS